MAAQTTPRKEETEQPINDTLYSPITIHSSWSEIKAELEKLYSENKRIRTELQQLKEEA